MRTLILLLIVALLSCNDKKATQAAVCDCSVDSALIVDSMKLQNAMRVGTMEPNIKYLQVKHDTIILRPDRKLTDSLLTALYLVNFKIERVRFYLNICLKNSSQDKFLKGWIKRAIE